jgi:hypothetical protein
MGIGDEGHDGGLGVVVGSLDEVVGEEADGAVGLFGVGLGEDDVVGFAELFAGQDELGDGRGEEEGTGPASPYERALGVLRVT